MMPKRKSASEIPLSVRRGVQLMAHTTPVRCLLDHEHSTKQSPKYITKRQQLARHGQAPTTLMEYAASRSSTTVQPVMIRAFRPPSVPRPRRVRLPSIPATWQSEYAGGLHAPTSNAKNDIPEVSCSVDQDSDLSDGEWRSHKFEIRRLERELRAETARADALQKQTASLLVELNMLGGFETLQSKVYVEE